METYLTTQEAIGCAGRLLDEHDPDITITEKVFSVMENIYTQLISETDDIAYVLGSSENVELLESCFNEEMSKNAREEYMVLYETACAIHNNW